MLDGGTIYAGIEDGKLAALNPEAESGSECANGTDDDGDGWVNEGCPQEGARAEGGNQCRNDTNDDQSNGAPDDDKVNDGCPGFVPLWVFPPNTDEGKKVDLDGIYGTPVVSDGTVYFGAYDDRVYALDAADGTERWQFRTGDPIVGSVVLKDGRLYVGSTDGNLYVLDAADGSEMDRFAPGEEIWSAPLVTDSAIYVGTVAGHLYALDHETLDPIWESPFKAAAGLITDPVLADDNTVLVGGIDKRLHALNTDSGAERWSFKAGNWFWGRPLVAGGVAYVPSLDQKVYALNVQDGAQKWAAPFQAQAPVRSSPLLVGGTLIVADRSGNVYGLEPETGKLSWAGPSLVSGTVLSDPLVLDGKVLLVAEGGDLFQVDPQAGAATQVRVLR